MNMENKIKKQEKFQDASELDKKIPKDLLMKYQGKWYILKAGLEWKASQLFGGGNYGIVTEIIEKKDGYVLAKATLSIFKGDFVNIKFSNFGEASIENVQNKNMHKYLLHLAVTRAECRVLRMATACGYMSSDEMGLSENNEREAKEIPESKEDEGKPTGLQMQTIKSLTKGQKDLPKRITNPVTFKQAKEVIAELAEVRK